MPTTDEPILGYVTLTAGETDLTVPAGTRFRRPRLWVDEDPSVDPLPPLENRETVVVPARRMVEVPLFEVASNPTIRLDDVRRLFQGRPWVRDTPLRDVQITANLEGVTFQIVPHWKPRTQQAAREGMLRLLKRRMESQPRRWWERL